MENFVKHRKVSKYYENDCRTYINFGNDETHAQKSLIPTQKPNCFDQKHYKGRWTLKFEFVFTINNGDCDARCQCHFVCLHVWIIYLT